MPKKWVRLARCSFEDNGGLRRGIHCFRETLPSKLRGWIRGENKSIEAREYVSELIEDMQSAEGKKFSREDLKDRLGYIRVCMNAHKLSLSDSEILDLLTEVQR